LNPLTGQLLDLLEAYGPWLLFALTLLETSFLWGLVIPAGVAISVGTVLAMAGTLELPDVAAAALAGGALGDSAGYWIGRATGERILSGRSPWARAVRAHQHELGRFFGRHPAYSVSAARLVSFVRTVMPLAAGMTGIRYPRFLAYEILGLAGCVVLYVAVGLLAQESWELATQLVGLGGALAFAVAGAVLWAAFRRRHRHRHEPHQEAAP
jgi:membrane protein DedA with SNARE-associated domain